MGAPVHREALDPGIAANVIRDRLDIGWAVAQVDEAARVGLPFPTVPRSSICNGHLAIIPLALHRRDQETK